MQSQPMADLATELAERAIANAGMRKAAVSPWVGAVLGAGAGAGAGLWNAGRTSAADPAELRKRRIRQALIGALGGSVSGAALQSLGGLAFGGPKSEGVGSAIAAAGGGGSSTPPYAREPDRLPGLVSSIARGLTGATVGGTTGHYAGGAVGKGFSSLNRRFFSDPLKGALTGDLLGRQIPTATGTRAFHDIMRGWGIDATHVSRQLRMPRAPLGRQALAALAPSGRQGHLSGVLRRQTSAVPVEDIRRQHGQLMDVEEAARTVARQSGYGSTADSRRLAAESLQKATAAVTEFEAAHPITGQRSWKPISGVAQAPQADITAQTRAIIDERATRMPQLASDVSKGIVQDTAPAPKKDKGGDGGDKGGGGKTLKDETAGQVRGKRWGRGVGAGAGAALALKDVPMEIWRGKERGFLPPSEN